MKVRALDPIQRPDSKDSYLAWVLVLRSGTGEFGIAATGDREAATAGCFVTRWRFEEQQYSVVVLRHMGNSIRPLKSARAVRMSCEPTVPAPARRPQSF